MRAIAFIILGVSVLGGCHGGMHRKGERMASVRLHGSPLPLEGRTIAWHGERSHKYIGAGLWNHWFTSDRVALGAGVSYNNYRLPGDYVSAIEFEGNYRHYLFEHQGRFAYFWDFYGGAQYADEPVPDGATQFEYPFGFGPGMEGKLGENSRVLVGALFHHQSNARGRAAEENPSQNDLRLWLSIGWIW